MNIKLVYDQTDYNIDVLSDTPCQYLFKVTNKVFRIPMNHISLFYNNIEIKNNSRLIFSVMGKTDKESIKPEETIIVKKINVLEKSQSGNLEYQKNNNSASINRYNTLSRNNPLFKSKQNNEQNKLPIICQSTEKIKLNKIKQPKKQSIMKCQLCNIKNSIFYCRVCNLFICMECNVRYNEHQNHEIINLEDGDTFLGCDVYREEILNEINVVELGFQQSSEFIIENSDRESYLQSLFKSLEQIKNNSQALADLKTMYDLDQNMINDFREEVDKIPKPKHKEEIPEIFGNLNSKETELRNYTKFINLQIIKTEYNKVFLQHLDKVKKYFDQLITEVKSRLNDCEDVKNRGIEDIRSYLKEMKNHPQTISDENFLFKSKLKQKRRSVYYNSNNNNNPPQNIYKSTSNLLNALSTSNAKENIKPTLFHSNNISSNNIINNYSSKNSNKINEIIGNKKEKKSKLDKDFGKSNEKSKKPIKIYSIENTIKEENKNLSFMSDDKESLGSKNIKNSEKNLLGPKQKELINSLKSPTLSKRKFTNDFYSPNNSQSDHKPFISKKATMVNMSKFCPLNLNNVDKKVNTKIKTEEKQNSSEDKISNKSDKSNKINTNNNNKPDRRMKKKNSLLDVIAELGENKIKNEDENKNDILIRSDRKVDEEAKKRIMRIKSERGQIAMDRLTPDEKKICFGSPGKTMKNQFFLKRSVTKINMSRKKGLV